MPVKSSRKSRDTRSGRQVGQQAGAGRPGHGGPSLQGGLRLHYKERRVAGRAASGPARSRLHRGRIVVEIRDVAIGPNAVVDVDDRPPRHGQDLYSTRSAKASTTWLLRRRGAHGPVTGQAPAPARTFRRAAGACISSAPCQPWPAERLPGARRRHTASSPRGNGTTRPTSSSRSVLARGRDVRRSATSYSWARRRWRSSCLPTPPRGPCGAAIPHCRRLRTSKSESRVLGVAVAAYRAPASAGH